jgi:hypothetical protein
MDYTRVGPRIYYANGYETGMVLEGASFEWSKPVTTRGPDTLKEYSDPPVGYLLEYFKGRMYVAQGNTVWFSEPFGTHLFDLARNFMLMDSELTMLHGVQSGLFVSTEYETFFVGGTNPRDYVLERVATYPAIRGTDVIVDASKIGDGNLQGVGVMWTSPEGICLGTADGQFFNLTERRLTYPSALKGAAVYTGDRYVVTLEP